MQVARGGCSADNSPNIKKRSAKATVATTTTSMSATVCNILAERVAACDWGEYELCLSASAPSQDCG